MSKLQPTRDEIEAALEGLSPATRRAFLLKLYGDADQPSPRSGSAIEQQEREKLADAQARWAKSASPAPANAKWRTEAKDAADWLRNLAKNYADGVPGMKPEDHRGWDIAKLLDQLAALKALDKN